MPAGRRSGRDAAGGRIVAEASVVQDTEQAFAEVLERVRRGFEAPFLSAAECKRDRVHREVATPEVLIQRSWCTSGSAPGRA